MAHQNLCHRTRTTIEQMTFGLDVGTVEDVHQILADSDATLGKHAHRCEQCRRLINTRVNPSSQPDPATVYA